MIRFELRGVKEAQKQLAKFKRSIPHALRNALNSMAFEARREWSGEIRKTMTIRAPYVARGALQVVKATGTRMTMEARVGSTLDFMAKQEHGGVNRGRSGRLPIAGPSAAGQAPGQHRTRLVRASNKLGAIQVDKTRVRGNQRQRNAAALRIARAKGKRVALLERKGGGLGLFAIAGGRRKLRTRLLWDLSRRSARVAPHPTLGPVMRRMEVRAPKLMHDALLQQLRRNRLFGYG